MNGIDKITQRIGADTQAEIDRILAEFSAEAAAHREDIQWDYDTLVHLDLIFARGQLSYKMNAVRPEVRRDGAIHLRKARHPLLDPKTAVPIDIELGDKASSHSDATLSIQADGLVAGIDAFFGF